MWNGARGRGGGEPQLLTVVPAVPEAGTNAVTAEAIADMATPSTCLMIEFTVLRSARSTVCPAYTLRAISSSVTGTFWPHLDTDAIPAVPVGMFAYGYSAPAPTASTARSVTNASDNSADAAPPLVRNRRVRIS